MDIKKVLPNRLLRAGGTMRDKIYWPIVKPYTFGASMAVTDRDLSVVALVRHAYGDKNTWHLPGGGLPKVDKRAEKASLNTPAFLDATRYMRTALREVHEEIGIATPNLHNPRLLFWEYSERTGNRNTELVFHSIASDFVTGKAVAIYNEPSEIAEARTFEISDLPCKVDIIARNAVFALTSGIQY